MEELCTLEQAKAVLGVYDDSQDSQIGGVIIMASAAIIDFCDVETIDDLSDRKKECLRAACLMLVPIIYDGTGEKEPDYDLSNGSLPRAVTMFLGRIMQNSLA